jgi:hypothetical protein
VRLVIADTGPLYYLVLIGNIDLFLSSVSINRDECIGMSNVVRVTKSSEWPKTVYGYRGSTGAQRKIERWQQ